MAYGGNRIKRSGSFSDWKKFSSAFSMNLGDCGEQITNWTRMLIKDFSKEWMEKLDASWPSGTMVQPNGAKFGGDHNHPWYTGQLHDSVAVVVSERNKVVHIQYMPPSANKPQTYRGPAGTYNRIIGHEWAMEEARKAQFVFLPGLQAKVIVGVPYARDVNNSSHHYGYLDELNLFSSDLQDKIVSVMGENEQYRSRVFKPRKK